MDLTKFKNKTSDSTLSAEEWNELIGTLETEGNSTYTALSDLVKEYMQTHPTSGSGLIITVEDDTLVITKP